MAVVPAHGKVSLIVSEFLKTAAERTCQDINIVSYPVWIYIEDIPDDGKEKPAQPDVNETFKLARDIIYSSKSDKPRVGVQKDILPFAKWEFLCDTFGKENLADCEPVLRESRAYHTAWEIELLRDNAKLTEKAMFETYQQIEAGMTEQQIQHMWNVNCFAQGEEVYYVTHANVYAEDWSPKVFNDVDRPVKNGDLVRLDGGLWRYGYSADLGRSSAVGGKPAHKGMEKTYEALLKGYDKLIEMLGPGVKMCDIFHEVLRVTQEAGLPRYRRGHFGHSINCNRFGEEYPFISAVETRVFEPGMIFCTEIPYYSIGNQSYNLEDEVLITENGIEIFTHVPRTLNWTTLVK